MGSLVRVVFHHGLHCTHEELVVQTVTWGGGLFQYVLFYVSKKELGGGSFGVIQIETALHFGSHFSLL